MHFDLIIVGGGLVGASLALALQPSGLRIALIDAKKLNGPDRRLFALSDTTCQFLTQLELWPQLKPHASDIESIHVSFQGHFGALRMFAKEAGLKQLGFVIPAAYVEEALQESIAKQNQLNYFHPAELIAIDCVGETAKLVIETEKGNQAITASFVVAADGADSFVRQSLNFELDQTDYQQTAIVTRTLLKQPHKNIAYERFTKNGAIAMLPLVGLECATIWTLNESYAQTLLRCSPKEFLNELQTQFGSRLGPFQGVTKRYSYPLRFLRAKKILYKNVILIGNAAHTLHPIAAQGFNLAIYEVAILAEYLLKSSQQSSLDRSSFVNAAELIREQQNYSIQFSHQVAQWSQETPQLFSIFGSLGCFGLKFAPSIKKRLLQSLLGRHGRIPEFLLQRKEL